MTENKKRTALYDIHLQSGGKIIDFAGWALPIQYEGLIAEHEAVRNNVGIFDVSHMGEVEVKGADALPFIQHLITNDASTLEDNQVLYSLMCYDDGGIVDDLLVYKFSNKYFYLVINAGNVDKDYKWMIANKEGFDVSIENISDDMGQLALQGPLAEKTLQKLTDTDLSKIKFFYCDRNVDISGVKCLVSRTGYTGEDGFEIYTNEESIDKLWNNIMDAGKEYGIKPAGLGARDTLRFEATLPLYGHEISEVITPLEAGLGFFVKLDKDHFVGKEALVKQKEQGVPRKIVGFEMKERGIPREGYDVAIDDNKIGFVTTGYFSPTLKKNIGLAIIDSKYAKLDTEISILIRNKPKKAVIISKRFYQKKYKK
ncbi:glycine cleavage system aminomethyltransferase GcvT [Dethiothermospora halolimnae]|uniref:glycine cleavage system aminomethyltransferase GcvT n=1 Tax=Dethiothermospora halolimnae TaxID=3114390 RepID=UPI003CCC4130